MEENASWLFENFTGDQALLDSFAENVQEAVSMQQTVLETSNKDLQKAQEIVLNKYQPLVEKAVNTLIQISESAEASAETDYQKTTKMQSTLVVLQLSMAGLALVLTLLLSTYLTRAITKPLRELEESADKIVRGNFDITVNYKSKDELGSLADSFRNMAGILDDVISDASMILSEMADGNFDVRTRAEERRKELVKDVKKKAEAAKVAVRNIRRDANDVFKKQNKAGEITEDDLKKLEEETQKLTDKYVGQIDKTVEVKSKDIMTV